MSVTTLCHGCGQRLRIPEDYQRAKLRCPECGVMCDVPAGATAEKPVKAKKASRPSAAVARPKPPLPPPEPDPIPEDLPIPLAPEPDPPPRTREPDLAIDEDDGKPYSLGEPSQAKCPNCGRLLGDRATQCPGCGRDLRAGKKPAKVYEPFEKSWEAGWPLRKRQIFFYLGMLSAVAIGILITVSSGDWGSVIVSWLLFGGMLAFLLGTYPRVDLSRDKRGRITLTKTWRLCFYPRQPARFDVNEYEGVRTGMASDVSTFDWIIVFLLFPAGILPGIFWWYCFIHTDQHNVYLMKEHGFAAEMLYQGISQDHARDMAGTLQEVARLPWEGV